MESEQKSTMRSIFYFDSMLMPKIITFVYWILLAGVVASGLAFMNSESAFGGALIILIGTVCARLWCEFMIVLFKINENIQKIADRAQ